ncbi:hypothetical protein NMG60_11030074 [Bertholletia excelsa]
MKAQQDKAENAMLRAENENLKNENYQLQVALQNIICPNCGGPAMLGEMSFDEQQLRLENAKLKEELERVCCIASVYSGQPMQAIIEPSTQHLEAPSLDLDMAMYPRTFQDLMPSCIDVSPPTLLPENAHFPGSGLIEEEEKPLVLELAASSMDELVKICQAGEPLWIQTNGKEEIDVDEHGKVFQWSENLKQNNARELKMEVTRESAVVIMNSVTLVDAFLDANKWMDLFPSIVATAKTLQVVISEVSAQATGSLYLMYAELQALSPLVPTREAHFLRYCQQNVEEGTWVIVDFPLESLRDCLQPSFLTYKRRPSGCIIQDMPNGYSKVIWVEQAEVGDKPAHQIFEHYVNSGLAFGARRWLAILQRQCERIASLMARNIPDLGVIPSLEARKNLMHLAQRMLRLFCTNISTSGGRTWTSLSDSPDDTVRISTRRANGEAGQPQGLILTAVSTTWLPHPHHQVFDLLKDERRRAQLDLLSNGCSLNEVAHIANGSHPGNCVSLIRINITSNSSQNVELMLQESCIDDCASIVAFATINVDYIQLAMSREDTSDIPLLPLGFVVIPVGHSAAVRDDAANSSPPPDNGSSTEPGCLLTVGLQIMASAVPTAKINHSSVTAVSNHLSNTVHQISTALSNGGSDGDGVVVSSSAEPIVAEPPSE